MSFRELLKRRAAAAAARATDQTPPAGHDVSAPSAEPAAPAAAPVAPVAGASLESPPSPVGSTAHDAVERLPAGADVLVAGFAAFADVAEALATQAGTLTVLAGRGHRAEWPQAVATIADTWSEALAPRRFGAILASEPLTHGADPRAFLRAARSRLAEGGVLVAVVPNVAFGDTRLALVKGEFDAPDGTLHHYTFRKLRELLAVSGFEVADVHRHRARLFAGMGAIAPELFPEALVKLVASDDEADVTHFVVTARPASPESLIAGLFSESDKLRALARNELARAARTHDALTERLKEADETRRTLEGALEALQREEASLKEFHDAAEANIRRLAAEADEATTALAAFQHSWAYRLARLFGGAKPQPKKVPYEPAEWVYGDDTSH